MVRGKIMWDRKGGKGGEEEMVQISTME